MKKSEKKRSYIKKELKKDVDAFLDNRHVKKFLSQFHNDLQNKGIISDYGGVNKELNRKINSGYTWTEIRKIGEFKQNNECSDYIRHMLELGILEKKGKFHKVKEEYHLIAKRAHEFSIMEKCKASQIYSPGLIDETLLVDVSVYGIHRDFLLEEIMTLFNSTLKVLCNNYYAGIFRYYALLLMGMYDKRLLKSIFKITGEIEDEVESRVRSQVALYFFYDYSHSIFLKIFSILNPMNSKIITPLRHEETEFIDLLKEHGGIDACIGPIRRRIKDALRCRRQLYLNLPDVDVPHEQLARNFGEGVATSFAVSMGRPFGERSITTLTELATAAIEILKNGHASVVDYTTGLPVVILSDEIIEMQNVIKKEVDEIEKEINEKVRPPVVVMSPSDLSNPKVFEAYCKFHDLSPEKATKQIEKKREKWLEEKFEPL